MTDVDHGRPAQTADTDAILSVEHVDLGYGELKVVHDLSLRVGRRELVGLVGGNGSGKSSMLRAISGMITPWAGRIVFDGDEIQGQSSHRIAARGIAHVPMGRQLFENMTVEENLSLGAYVREAKAHRARSFERVYELFPDLFDRRGEMAGALSGGQQQMVAIGRALMLDPKMLIMDEPSLGLAPLLVKEVMQVVQRVAATGLPILLVEQNVTQVLKVADRAYVLENGRLVTSGPSARLMGDPEIKRAYLGL